MKLLKRIITGIILALLFSILIISENTIFFIGIMLISVICLYELLKIKKLITSKKELILPACVLIGISITMLQDNAENIWHSPYIIVAIFLSISIQLNEILKKQLISIPNKWVNIFFSTLTISFTIPMAILIRNSPNGIKNALFVTALCCISDIMAYFSGKLFGKTQFSTISPKKTWEGTILGFCSSLTTGIILINVLQLPNYYYIITIIVCCFFPIGDLHESLIKRSYNTKDSSNILPGHGGLYDRTDSFLFALPIFYYMLLFFNQF